ncbi:hypothetical protein [Geobacter sp. AOG2]|uniref:phosphorylase family protein n=1 Tax=Geobacter sp. AOG2 TaxID=1566347 RepID=UPI0035A69BAE
MISGEPYYNIKADMVDMETFSAWRACQKFSVPMIGIRGVSDGKKELACPADWEKHLDKLCQAVDKLEAAINIGSLRPHSFK